MLIKEIINRRSVREYKSDAVSDELILEIIKAAQFAPTAVNNRSVEFIVVKDQSIKNKLDEILESKQEYVKKVPVIIVPIVDTKASLLPVQDLAVASENIFLQAAAFGLGTVWKNVRAEPALKIKTLLNIPAHFTLANIIPVGYPLTPPEPHTDSDFSTDKIHYEKFISR